jgi:hypothetical protein
MKYFTKFGMAFFAALSTGCGTIIIALTSRIFEISDYSIFNVYYSSRSPVEIILEGMVLHSAVGAYKIETLEYDKTLQIIIHGALMHKYTEAEGVLNYKISVPDSINIIVVGNNKTIIWDRNDENWDVKVWRFGKEMEK